MYHTCSHANVGKIIATMGCIMGRIMTKNGGEITKKKLEIKVEVIWATVYGEIKGKKITFFRVFF